MSITAQIPGVDPDACWGCNLGFAYLTVTYQLESETSPGIHRTATVSLPYDPIQPNADIIFEDQASSELLLNQSSDFLLRNATSDTVMAFASIEDSSGGLAPLEVFVCPGGPAGCATPENPNNPNSDAVLAESVWGRVKLDAIDTSTPVALDLKVTLDGQIFVAYMHRQQMRLAHCYEHCADINNWRNGVVHVDAELLPLQYNNRFFWWTIEPDILNATAGEMTIGFSKEILGATRGSGNSEVSYDNAGYTEVLHSGKWRWVP